MLCLCVSPAEQLRVQLLEIHALLVRVGNMSALVALIKAASVRDDFQRTNRDLINTFNILAHGEQLLVSRRWFAAVLQGMIACKGRDLKWVVELVRLATVPCVEHCACRCTQHTLAMLSRGGLLLHDTLGTCLDMKHSQSGGYLASIPPWWLCARGPASSPYS
jgi:hypothetical protein